MTSYDLRNYLVHNDLFSGGSNEQYRKMLMCDNLYDKAIIIWVCSTTTKTVEEILNDLRGLE